MQNNFKTGDIVLVKSYGDCVIIGGNSKTGPIDDLCKSDACGSLARITKVCRSGNLKLEDLEGGEYEGTFNPKWVTKSSQSEETYNNNASNACTKNTPMISIIKFVKNLALTADQKLLIKYNLKTECGDYTQTAKELVINYLVSQNEAYLITQATAFDAAEKADKSND